ncbi:hypothetical protein H0H87_000553 [Tephrocybe sp. NHM501043]|nr:hypothetical protein H0H87_000553 [Tephrocybe sp. NHM501043]
MDESNKLERQEPMASLITPSVSPPRTRPFFLPPCRIPDQASPTKRPRLSSAPRQVQRHASSSATPFEPIDLHKAREDSARRCYNIWAGLAERHSRPMDEDDIIDIMTGKVVKDRGVLRGSQTWPVGAFAEPEYDDAEEVEEVEDEDDLDELDSFADGGIELEDDILSPPSSEMEAINAEDLEEFFEAEKRRRELYGSEVDETEGSIFESQAEEDESRYSEPVSRSSSHIVASEDKDSVYELSERDETPHHVESVYVDSGSEDELGGWDLAEASVVYRLPKAGDSDSDIEFVDRATPSNNVPLEATDLSPEVPLPPWTSPRAAPPQKNGKKRSYPNQHQLQTPPQSQASSNPSVTPDDDYLSHLPPPTSSPPRSSSPFSVYHSSPIRPSQSARKSEKPVSERRQTLQPRKHLSDTARGIPRLDLTKVTGERLIKSKRTSSRGATASVPSSEARSSSSGPAKPRVDKSAPSSPASRVKEIPNRDVEVVILRRTPFQEIPAYARDIAPSKTETISRKPRLSAKAKGKQRAASNDEQIEPVEEDFINEEPPLPQSSPPKARKEGKAAEALSRGRSRQPSSATTTPASVESKANLRLVPVQAGSSSKTPKPAPLATRPLPLTAGKKRKRVVSSMQSVDNSGSHGLEPSQMIEERISEEKRPRSRNSSVSRSSHLSSDAEPVEPEISRMPEARRKRKQTTSQRQRHRSPESDSDDNDSEEDGNDVTRHQSRHHSRAPYFNESYYQYSGPPYPPHHPHDQQLQQPMHTPFQDPRAQHIVTQAIQQILALSSASWGLPPPNRGSTPFTPQHYRHHPRADSHGPPMYSTPMHHPHPYPYSYDPMMSNATLPPSSPEAGHSSPPRRSASASVPRRKSLVKRSRSRGRTVSFEDEENEVESDDNPTEKTHARAEESRSKERRSDDRDYRVSESENRSDKPHNRTPKRHQTPGPPLSDHM